MVHGPTKDLQSSAGEGNLAEHAKPEQSPRRSKAEPGWDIGSPPSTSRRNRRRRSPMLRTIHDPSSVMMAPTTKRTLARRAYLVPGSTSPTRRHSSARRRSWGSTHFEMALVAMACASGNCRLGQRLPPSPRSSSRRSRWRRSPMSKTIGDPSRLTMTPSTERTNAFRAIPS